MGRVNYRKIPDNHPIFKSGWLITTIKYQSQKLRLYDERKLDRRKK